MSNTKAGGPEGMSVFADAVCKQHLVCLRQNKFSNARHDRCTVAIFLKKGLEC